MTTDDTIEADAARWRRWLAYAEQQGEDAEDTEINLTAPLAVDLVAAQEALAATEKRLALARAAISVLPHRVAGWCCVCHSRAVFPELGKREAADAARIGEEA